jgi:shikimate dehydrogenase
MQVPEGDLAVVMAALTATVNVDGILVTMPHKFTAFAYCATIAIALLAAGVSELVVHDADASRAAALLDLLVGPGGGRVIAGAADPAGRDLVFNATPMGMEAGDPLPVDAALLTSSMFVGDVIAGHGVTPFIGAAQAAGCKTADGGHMVEAVQDLMADFMLVGLEDGGLREPSPRELRRRREDRRELLQ